MIRRTRKHRQHVAARYGVTHLDLNVDAMARLGFSATTGELLEEPSSDSDSGSSGARPPGKRYRDHMGSAEPEDGVSVRPQWKRNRPFPGVSERPQGKQSKNLPSGMAITEGSEGVLQ